MSETVILAYIGPGAGQGSVGAMAGAPFASASGSYSIWRRLLSVAERPVGSGRKRRRGDAGRSPLIAVLCLASDAAGLAGKAPEAGVGKLDERSQLR